MDPVLLGGGLLAVGVTAIIAWALAARRDQPEYRRLVDPLTGLVHFCPVSRDTVDDLKWQSPTTKSESRKMTVTTPLQSRVEIGRQLSNFKFQWPRNEDECRISDDDWWYQVTTIPLFRFRTAFLRHIVAELVRRLASSELPLQWQHHAMEGYVPLFDRPLTISAPPVPPDWDQPLDRPLTTAMLYKNILLYVPEAARVEDPDWGSFDCLPLLLAELYRHGIRTEQNLKRLFSQHVPAGLAEVRWDKEQQARRGLSDSLSSAALGGRSSIVGVVRAVIDDWLAERQPVVLDLDSLKCVMAVEWWDHRRAIPVGPDLVELLSQLTENDIKTVRDLKQFIYKYHAAALEDDCDQVMLCHRPSPNGVYYTRTGLLRSMLRLHRLVADRSTPISGHLSALMRLRLPGQYRSADRQLGADMYRLKMRELEERVAKHFSALWDVHQRLLKPYLPRLSEKQLSAGHIAAMHSCLTMYVRR